MKAQKARSSEPEVQSQKFGARSSEPEVQSQKFRARSSEPEVQSQELGARGPMGLEEITTYKWLINGDGQTRP